MMRVLALCDAPEHNVWISAQSVCDITSIVIHSTPFRRRVPSKQTCVELARDLREKLFAYFNVVETDLPLLVAAHGNEQEPDFEDALIAEAARRVDAGLLISSDTRAFHHSATPKASPRQAVHLLSRL